MIEVLERKINETAYEYALRVIKYNIVSLNLIPGEMIRHEDICSLLSVSKTPVRDAIRELSDYKLVDIFPQRGSYVAKIDPQVVESAGYLRKVLEVEIVSSACEVASSEHLDQLYQNIALQKRYLGDIKRFFQLDDHFHQILYAMCGKEFLYEVVQRISYQYDRLRLLNLVYIDPADVFSDHEVLLYAVEAGDKARARQTIQEHLARVEINRFAIKEKYSEYIMQ